VYTSPPQLDAARSLGYPLDKTRLIPWGVETGVFRPFPPDKADTRHKLGIVLDSPLVFSPRGIAPIYQIHKIIQAFEQVRIDCPEARLLLLKSSYQPAYLAELESFIQEHRMQAGVIWLTQERTFEMEPMALLYRAADVTVSFPTSEGYGLTVYEAIACGCPTVISDIRTFDGVLQDQVHTLKVPVDDTQALARAMTRLFVSPALREEISKNALKLVDELSIETRITKTIELYNEFTSHD